MQHIGDVVNASLRYFVQNTWGYKNEQSQWSGMIGELQRQEADVGGKYFKFVFRTFHTLFVKFTMKIKLKWNVI